MEQSKKPRRHYDDDFKRDAVRLMAEGGRSVSQLARDLGVTLSQLQRWNERFGEKSAKIPGAAEPVNDAELEKMRRELALVKEEREILKKALAVFSRRPG